MASPMPSKARLRRPIAGLTFSKNGVVSWTLGLRSVVKLCHVGKYSAANWPNAKLICRGHPVKNLGPQIWLRSTLRLRI